MSIGLPLRRPSRSWQRMVTHVELGGAFQVRHLEVELERATTFKVDSRAERALTALAAGNFDRAPVTDAGVVIGYVERQRVAAVRGSTNLRELIEPLNGALLVSADTPIGDLFEWIAEQPFLFIIDGRNISGFVTVTDLNKQPARAYLYLVLAGLEIALADLVRWRYGTNQKPLLELLGTRDQDAVRSRHGGDRDADADSDLVSYLGFKHLLRIFEKDRGLRAELGRYSQRSWRTATRPLSELRNDVMHPVSSFVSTSRDVAKLAADVEQARVLVDQSVGALRRHYSVPDPRK